MKSYFAKLDGLLSGENGEVEEKKPKSREEQYNHSVKQLMKLNELMRPG